MESSRKVPLGRLAAEDGDGRDSEPAWHHGSELGAFPVPPIPVTAVTLFPEGLD